MFSFLQYIINANTLIELMSNSFRHKNLNGGQVLPGNPPFVRVSDAGLVIAGCGNASVRHS